jgi:hypothetical protein
MDRSPPFERGGVRSGQPNGRKTKESKSSVVSFPTKATLLPSLNPFERGPAMMTLAADQNAPYRVVATVFRHSGFTLTQLKRVGDVAIYRQAKSGLPDAYEVVLIEKHEGYTAFGKDIPAGEYYPSSAQWGLCGFTFRTLQEAERKFLELAQTAKEVA